MTTTKIDHYAEAERLLERSMDFEEYNDSARDRFVAQAAVHATLANAEANAHQADADKVVASAVDPDGNRLRVAARPL